MTTPKETCDNYTGPDALYKKSEPVKARSGNNGGLTMIHYEAITFAADFVVQPCSHPSYSGVHTADIRTRYTAISLPQRKRSEYDPVLLFWGFGNCLWHGYGIQ